MSGRRRWEASGHGRGDDHPVPRRAAARARPGPAAGPGRQRDRRGPRGRSRCAAAASRACGRSATARTRSCASAPRARPRTGASRARRSAERLPLGSKLPGSAPSERDEQRGAALLPGLEQAGAPSGPRARSAPGRPRGCRGVSSGSWRARPPARSTAAIFSCTASAVTCSSKKSRSPSPRRARRSARGVAAVGDRGGHLEQREVADDRAAPAAVQAEQRHQVDGRERDARDARRGRRRRSASSPSAVHRLGEQRARACASARPPPYSSAWISTSAAFGAPLQPRERPRVRVGLLELVGGAVDDELEQLLARALALEVAWRATARRRSASMRAQRDVHLLGRDAAPGRAQRARSARPRSAPRGAARSASSDGSHSQRVVDAVEAAVVQLVTAGRARAGGPRRPAGRRAIGVSGARTWCGSRTSASRRACDSGPRGTGSDGTVRRYPVQEGRNRAETCRRAGRRPPRRRSRPRRAGVRGRPLAARPVARRLAADPARRGDPVGRGGAAALPPGRSGAGAGARGASRRRRCRPSRPTTASTSTRPTPPSSSGSRASARSARAGSSRSARPAGRTGTVGDLVRVAGFGPSRVRGLGRAA